MARCIAISRICLFSMFVVLLSACGGSGGGGSDSTNDPGNPPPSSGNQTPPPAADSANAYLPTDPAIKWTFNDTLQLGFLPDDVSSGAHVHALTYPTGGKEYFVTGTNQINLQGLYLPTISVGDGVNYTGDIRFNNLLVILQGDSTPTTSVNVSGAGTINISPTYGKHDISFSGTIDYVSDESVSTALGSFTAKRINIDLTLTTTIEGRNFQLPYNVTFWFAKNVGIVKRDQEGVVYLLSSISGLNIDSAISADPDPANDPGTDPGTGEEPDPGTDGGSSQPPSGSVNNVFITYKNTNTVLSENSSQPVEITVDPNNFTITTPPIPGSAAIRICATKFKQTITVGNSIFSYTCFQPGASMAMPSITAEGIPLYVSNGVAYNAYNPERRVDTPNYTALPINDVQFVYGTSLGPFYLVVTADKNGNNILDQGELWAAHINMVDSDGTGIGIALTTSISSDVTALSFFTHTNSSSVNQNLLLTFAGDAVAVDSAPYWLTLTPASASPVNMQSYSISATATYLSAGTYTDSIRFKSVRIPPGGDINQAVDVAYVNVPVTVVVSDFALSTQAINLTTLDGSGAVQQDIDNRTFSLSGTSIDWSLSSDQPWLTFTQATGSGPAAASFSIATSGLGLGIHTAHISAKNANTGEVLDLPVTVTVNAPQLVLNPQSLSFSVDGQTTTSQLSKSIDITDELNGSDALRAVSWHVESIDAPWIASVTPSSGSSAHSMPLITTLSPTALSALSDGEYNGNIAITYTGEDRQPHAINVPVKLQIKMPRVQWVAPQVVYAGQQYEVILRGSGFNSATNQPIYFGTAAANNATKISDTEIRVTYPPLSAGNIQVRVDNNLHLNIGSTRLVARGAGALPAAKLASTGRKAKIFFDNERQVLYAVDVEAQRIDRAALKKGSWAFLEPILITNVQDAALSTNGSKLVAVTNGSGIYEVDLAANSSKPVKTLDSTEFLWRIEFTNHNLAIVTTLVGGIAPSYKYDLDNRLLISYPYPQGYFQISFVSKSEDGRRVLIVQDQAPSASEFNSSIDTLTATPLSGISNDPISLSRNAEKMLFSGAVYDINYKKLGRLSLDTPLSSAISPDAVRAYYYEHSDDDVAAPKDIAVYDLRTNPAVGEYFPVLTRIPISSSLSVDYNTPEIAISGDGLTIFLWGNNGLQIIPLQ